jgi:hypothetical protein
MAQLYMLGGLTCLTFGAMVASIGSVLSLGALRERQGAAIASSAGVNSAGLAAAQLGGCAIAFGFGIRMVFLATVAVVGLASIAVGRYGAEAAQVAGLYWAFGRPPGPMLLRNFSASSNVFTGTRVMPLPTYLVAST